MKHLKHFVLGLICGVGVCLCSITIDQWYVFQISILNEEKQELIQKNNELVQLVKEYDLLIPECLKCVYMFRMYDIQWYKDKMEAENNDE